MTRSDEVKAVTNGNGEKRMRMAQTVVGWIIAIAGAGVMWGVLSTRVCANEKAIEGKASKEVVDRVEKRLERIENKLDAALAGK